ncbi:MAG: hypothetical protein E7357_04450 [Clostridiales bacterium]|nr:hypothetical protein [Clostridiales bacterium]
MEIVKARTNAEFLNKEYGTNYKAWYKSRWPYDIETWVWMVRIDGKVRDGWRNLPLKEGGMLEEFVGPGTPTYFNEKERRYRIIVDIVETSTGREYHIIGKYRYDKERSNEREHVFVKERFYD